MKNPKIVVTDNRLKYYGKRATYELKEMLKIAGYFKN